jgi:uncharacterized C2H2 Zn-finger protein
MAKEKFKCSECGRTFSMAAHLARHTNTTHAAKAGRKKVRKKATKRRPKRKGERRAKRKVRRLKGRAKKVVRAKAVRRPMRRRPVRRRAARRAAAAGTSGLARQLQAHRRALSAEHAELEAQIAAVTGALKSLGGAAAPEPAGRGRRRPVRRRAARAGSLKGFILKVLRQSGKPLGPADIAARVVRAGYKTKAKNLPNMVSNALSKTAGVRKAGRGLYRA